VPAPPTRFPATRAQAIAFGLTGPGQPDIAAVMLNLLGAYPTFSDPTEEGNGRHIELER